MDASPAKAESPKLDGKMVAVALLVALGAVTVMLDMTIIGVAINTISADFSVGLTTVQWVTTTYILSSAMVVPLSGWATNRFGGRRVWLFSLALFTVGSIACGFAWSAGSLIAFRVLQGVAAGLTIPVGMAMVARTAGPERMGRAMSLVGVPMVLGPILGPVLGGVLVDTVNWRWIFLINIPIGLVAIIGSWIVFDRDTPMPAEKLDLVGLALLGPGICLLVLGLGNVHTSGGAGPEFLIPGITSVVLLALFVRHAFRVEKPVLDLRLFRSGGFSSAVGIQFLVSATLAGTGLLFPLYYQLVRDESALASGLLLIPQGIGLAMMMPISGRMVDRGKAPLLVLIGIPTMAIGLLSYTMAGDDGSFARLCVSLWLVGIGAGCTIMPATSAAYRTLSHQEIPKASATFAIVQEIGASSAAAGFVISLEVLLVSNAPDTAAAFNTVFWLPLGLVLVAVIPAVVLARKVAQAPPGPSTVAAEAPDRSSTVAA